MTPHLTHSLQIFLPFSRLYFSLLTGFFCYTEAFFAFVICTFASVRSKKQLSRSMLIASPHLLSCRSFKISDLMFQSLAHYELIFGSGIKYRSNFIFLHVFLWFSQHDLMKRRCFPHWVSLALLLSIGWGISWWEGSLCAVCSVPWVCVSSFAPGPYCFLSASWYSLKSGSVMLSSSFSCLLWVFGVFHGSIQILEFSKNTPENTIEI